MLNPLIRVSFLCMCMTASFLCCQGQELHPVPDLSKPVHWGEGVHMADTLVVLDVQGMAGIPSKADTLQWKLYEKGDATYYSARTHGRMMASGERYDKNGLFCAHKKLPFGTKIRVVNKKNGKEVMVVVKDRGPFAKGRVIDLSNKAAEQIGMLSAGVVPVELWVMEESED